MSEAASRFVSVALSRVEPEDYLRELEGAGDPGLRAAVGELRRVLAKQVPCERLAVSRVSLADCAALRAAVRADGYPAKSWLLPGEGVEGAAAPTQDELLQWIIGVDRKVTFRAKTVVLVETELWFAAQGEWLAQLRRVYASRRLVDEFFRRVRNRAESLRRRRAGDEWRAMREREAAAEREAEREAAERARAARAAELERKAAVRRALSDAARAASQVQGFAVLSARDLEDARPRWLYLLLGQDGSLYAGSGLSVRARLRAHRRGIGAAVTRDNRQPWYLLHAERFAVGSAALCAEFALLHSVPMQEALLFQVAARARRYHARFGCAVPWLGLSAVHISTGSAERSGPQKAA